MESYISIKNVSYSYYGKEQALCNVNLDIRKGDLLCIIGQNGSGKSTLLHVINALIFPDSGTFEFCGKAITEKYLKDANNNLNFRMQFGYIFQNPDIQLFCPSVIDELLFAPLQLQLSREEAEKRAHDTMKYIGIEHLKERSVLSLSGGEKKKVAIASILTMNPEVILIDEPLAGLDPKTQTFFTEMIIELHRIGKTIVFTTHNLELIDHLQPKVAVISEQHSVIKVGTTTEILNDEELLKNVNLLHEHTHIHGNEVHRHYHSHYVFHKHE
ncbi:MAG: nickel ABC transporter ATP-binding protein [Bacteroidetes bacterium HGW-Bacteroidetes-21]|jgi:cobalt/nickel transport system ATP-binding protein|nr:MAG: nickel ABC transporter ATP-binding protein [Bacteroidetes bacterium HGW-Bacteroidetes-21]